MLNAVAVVAGASSGDMDQEPQRRSATSRPIQSCRRRGNDEGRTSCKVLARGEVNLVQFLVADVERSRLDAFLATDVCVAGDSGSNG
jgi:hypothetical protein